MGKLMRTLARQFALMVSLPKNDPKLAEAAVRAGAQVLKVHLNCHHHASGTTFGSWVEEQGVIREILSAAGTGVAVGVVTGEAVQPSREQLLEIEASGLEFWDLFAKFTPPAHFKLNMGRMVAVDSTWSEELLKDLQMFGVQVIEGSVVPKTEYGTDLNLVDLCTYARLCRVSDMPVLIPTQKKIKPEEVGLLRQAGAAGITIGAIVTGLELSSLEDATARFAKAIQALPRDR